MDFSDKTIETLKDCRTCPVALVSDVRAKVQEGHKVTDICRALERLDEQFHGDAYMTATQYRNFYYNTFRDEKPKAVLNHTESKSNKATKVVDALTKQHHNPNMPSDIKDLVGSMVDDASIDTTTSMLVDTEINDRVNRAFKMLDDVIGAWEVSDKAFWLDLEYIKLNLERIKRKVEAHEKN